MATTLKQLMSTVEEGDKKITDLQTEGNATLDQIRVGLDKFFKNQERSKLDQLENDRERSKIVKQVTAKGSGGSSVKQDVDLLGLAMLAAGLAIAATSGDSSKEGPIGPSWLTALGGGVLGNSIAKNRTRFMNATKKFRAKLIARNAPKAPPVEPGAREPKPFESKTTPKPGAREPKPPKAPLVKPEPGTREPMPYESKSTPKTVEPKRPSQGNRPLAKAVQKTAKPTTPATKYPTGESSKPPVGTGNPAIQQLKSIPDAVLKERGVYRIQTPYGDRYGQNTPAGFRLISAEAAAAAAKSPNALVRVNETLDKLLKQAANKYPKVTWVLRGLLKVGLPALVALDIIMTIRSEDMDINQKKVRLAGIFSGLFAAPLGAAIAGAAAGLIGLTTGPGAILSALAGGAIAYFYGAWAGEQFAYWLLDLPITQELPDLSTLSDKQLQAVGLKRIDYEGDLLGYKMLDPVTGATIGQIIKPGSVFLRRAQAKAAALGYGRSPTPTPTNPTSTTQGAGKGVDSTSANRYPANGDMVTKEDRAFIGQMENYPNAGRISTDDFRRFNSSSPYYKGAQLSSLEQERARQSSVPPTVVVQQDNRSSSGGSGGGQSAPPPQSIESKNWTLWERLGFGATMQPSP